MTATAPANQSMSFTFLDPGPLVDGELELVAPAAHRVDDLMAACRHPLTVRDMPQESSLTRDAVEQFLRLAPGGRQPGNPSRGWLPTYHFWMQLSPVEQGGRRYEPPLRIAGGLGFRVGMTTDIELYTGNIGYHVYPAARGNHYAERACRMVFPLAKRHGMTELWITCNPDNFASRRTCERLGGQLVSVVPIPSDHPFYARGERAKCRYLFRL